MAGMKRFVVVGGRMVSPHVARLLLKAQEEDEEDEEQEPDEEKQPAAEQHGRSSEEPDQQADSGSGEDTGEEEQDEDQEQTPQDEAQKLYRFWSDPRNQEGWSGPDLVQMALRFLDLVRQGVIEVPDDDPAVFAAQQYAEMAEDMRRLGLLGGSAGEGGEASEEGSEAEAEE